MYVCENCFLDEEMCLEIRNNSTIEGECKVCGEYGKLMDFSLFQEFFTALLSLFSIADNGNHTVAEVLQEDWHLFKDKDVAKVLLTEILSTYDCGYSVNDRVDYSDDIRMRVAVWDRLKKSIMENSRFFTNVDEFDKYNYLTAGKCLNANQILYRSRITPANKESIECDKMGCPPKELATAGRANPIGIPYLYLSDSAKTTYYEVRAVFLDRLSVGTFRIKRELSLVDFVYDVDLYLSFNEVGSSLKEVVIKKKVIEAISRDLSKPLRRYDSELEYVPTQLICEYCRRVVGADGVSFESSLRKGGRNYVLFDDSLAKCIKVDIHEITRIDIDKE